MYSDPVPKDGPNQEEKISRSTVSSLIPATEFCPTKILTHLYARLHVDTLLSVREPKVDTTQSMHTGILS